MVWSRPEPPGTRLACSLLAALLVSGCGGEESTTPGDAPPACPAPEVELADGSCLRPGVPPDGCAAGFAHDGEYGCEPILPEDGCPAGQVATPGDEACHSLMPCAPGRWGNIPTDATTQHVDGSYAGGGSDGTADRPWTRVQDAVDAAASGAIVALAAGSYAESVSIEGKAVRLRGVCPDRVEIADVELGLPAVSIGPGADGTVVRGLALRGPSLGLVVSGAQDVTVDRVRVHDTGLRGIESNSVQGPPSLHVLDVLIEDSHDTGLLVWGGEAEIERTVVRRTWPTLVEQQLGVGIAIERCRPSAGCDPSVPATATIRASIVEDSYRNGLYVYGAGAQVEGSVVRRTWPDETTGMVGFGVQTVICMPSDGCNPITPSSLSLTGSLVEDNHTLGMFVSGSKLDLEASIVRRTKPRQADGTGGRAINVQSCPVVEGCDPAVPSTLNVSHALLEDNRSIGIFLAGSQADIRSTVIRRTAERKDDRLSGRGINIQPDCDDSGCDPDAPSTATMDELLVDESRDVGVCVIGSTATLSRSVVTNTLAQLADGTYGDGVSVFSEGPLATLTVTNTRIADAERALLSTFGATARLGSSKLQCGSFALDGESYLGQPYAFENLGDNLCGCPTADGHCKAVSSGLTAPEPLAPTD